MDRSFNSWMAERFTPMDSAMIGAVASAVVVGTLALAQGIELVPETEPVGFLVNGLAFLAIFMAGITYLNQKNREVYYGTPLSIEFDHENGQVVLDGELAISIRLFPDGVPGDCVDSYGFETVGENAEGWYVGDGEEDDPYLEIAMEAPV